MSPIRSLVSGHLGNVQAIRTFEAAITEGWLAIASSGVGVDPFLGERILAATTFQEQVGDVQHELWLGITDQRTCVSGYSSIRAAYNDVRGSVAHPELQSVQFKEGMLATYVKLMGIGKPLEFTMPKLSTILGRFYEDICRVPMAQRMLPPSPWAEPTADDPTGVETATSQMWVTDEATSSMLTGIKALSGSVEPQVIADLVSRVVLDHRIRHGGPAMRDGRWLSPLLAQDLGHTIVGILGTPLQQWESQPGVFSLSFAMGKEVVDGLHVAVSALGVASGAILGFGLSPGGAIARAMMKRTPIRQLQLTFTDMGSFSAYEIRADGAPIETKDTRLAQRLHLALAWAAGGVLSGRCIQGWGVDYASLFNQQTNQPRQVALDPAWQPFSEPLTGGAIEHCVEHECVTTFPVHEFEAQRQRWVEWFQVNGWEVVPGSEVDQQRTAQGLRELGLEDAARLAEESPQFGGSYQQAGQTIAIVIDTMSGKTTRVHLSRI